jgi:hypothetical protein
MIEEGSLRPWRLIKKYIVGVVAFTFLWTATLIHDQIGFEIATLSYAITNGVDARTVSETCTGLSSQSRCPCAAEHLHSPSVSESLNKDSICVLNVQYFSLCILTSIAHVLASENVKIETRTEQLRYFESVLAAGEPLYLLKRSLLI